MTARRAAPGFVMGDKASGSGINAEFTSGRAPKITDGREDARSQGISPPSAVPYQFCVVNDPLFKTSVYEASN